MEHDVLETSDALIFPFLIVWFYFIFLRNVLRVWTNHVVANSVRSIVD